MLLPVNRTLENIYSAKRALQPHSDLTTSQQNMFSRQIRGISLGYTYAPWQKSLEVSKRPSDPSCDHKGRWTVCNQTYGLGFFSTSSLLEFRNYNIGLTVGILEEMFDACVREWLLA